VMQTNNLTVASPMVRMLPLHSYAPSPVPSLHCYAPSLLLCSLSVRSLSIYTHSLPTLYPLSTHSLHNRSLSLSQIMGANKGGGQKFRNIMQTPPQPNTEGYISTFVEIFVWVMTAPAYTALWELLSPGSNPYAWGYDFWYSGYAADTVKGHKMGIVSSMAVQHVQGKERSDNAGVKVKWNAVLAQERHYKMYKGVNLLHYRQHLDIANSSWSGAVKGLIPKCNCWKPSS
jgi:hypothetical protein